MPIAVNDYKALTDEFTQMDGSCECLPFNCGNNRTFSFIFLTLNLNYSGSASKSNQLLENISFY
jgi:hypothetical protein